MRASEELTPKMQAVIRALLAGESRDEAARIAGTSLRSVYRWARLPHFVSELRRARTVMLDATATALASGSASCAKVLVDIAQRGGPLDATRVSAARAVIDLAVRFEEQGEMARRIEELEHALSSQKTPGVFQ